MRETGGVVTDQTVTALLQGAVSQRETFGTLPAAAPALHVAFGVDDRYVRGMGVAVQSLVDCNPGLHLVVHVFYGSMSEDDRQRLLAQGEALAIELRLYRVEKSVFSGLSIFGQYSHAIYNRLLIASQVADDVARVLYIDADIVCLGPVDALLTLDLQGRAVAAVRDVEHGRQDALGMADRFYFNSGVILIDVAAWKRLSVSERTLAELAARRGQLTFPDQDALNIVLQGQVLELDRCWNQLYDMDGMAVPIPDDTRLLHYAAGCKPWFSWCAHPLQAHILRHHARSPWRDVPLDAPRNYKEMRVLARQLKRKGAHAEAMAWSLRALCARLGGRWRKAFAGRPS